jgi:predicted enzyme related to lactoylglutathione lyase
MTEGARDHRIDCVELPATDMAVVKRFYSKVFGWSCEDYGPDYACFSNGRMPGGLRKEPKVDPDGRRFHLGDPSGNELAVWSDH